VSALSMPLPASASNVRSVKLIGLSHTWIGDLQITVFDPAGNGHNLVVRPGLPSGSVCCGFSASYSGDYVFVDPTTPGALPWPATNPSPSLPQGTYVQEFGTSWGNVGWTSGNAHVFNTPMASIPATPGIWTLTIYDWAAGDSGAFAGWEISGDTGPTTPAPYCTSGTTTSGCNATVAASQQPSVSFANPCDVSISNVEGQRTGIVFYGLTSLPQPWCVSGGSSFLCVKPPTQRSGAQSTGGTIGQCDGTLLLDWNAFQQAVPVALGQPWSAGDKAYVQGWFRDPASCRTTSLSNGLELTYQP
jgi:hypothetical protein